MEDPKSGQSVALGLKYCSYIAGMYSNMMQISNLQARVFWRK